MNNLAFSTLLSIKSHRTRISERLIVNESDRKLDDKSVVEFVAAVEEVKEGLKKKRGCYVGISETAHYA